jgi:hypothetical protein
VAAQVEFVKAKALKPGSSVCRFQGLKPDAFKAMGRNWIQLVQPAPPGASNTSSPCWGPPRACWSPSAARLFVGVGVREFLRFFCWFQGFFVGCFLVSWFLGFLVSWFLGFLVSWFLGFLVSWFLGFLVSWLLSSSL